MKWRGLGYEYAVTDKSGVATFSDVLISGSTPYTLEEVDTAIRYVVPPTQTAPVKWKEVTNLSVDNILKKFAVTVTKSDYEEGTAQGDATLAGAVYGIYKGDTLIDEYVTDENGQFTTKEYICDTDWTIREIKPSEGYLLDDTVHAVGADPKLYTVEHEELFGTEKEKQELKWESFSVAEIQKELSVTAEEAKLLMNCGIFKTYRAGNEYRAHKKSVEERRKIIKSATTYRDKKTISVMELGRLLGLGKTAVYRLVNKCWFKTYLILGVMRIDVESFEDWYAGQFHYKKVTGERPGKKYGLTMSTTNRA